MNICMKILKLKEFIEKIKKPANDEQSFELLNGIRYL
jgi:hypothetical protein